MKNLKLVINTQGVKGGKSTNKEHGYGLLTAYKDGNTLVDISIDTYEGLGSHYKERENHIIEIYIPSMNGEKRFKGTVQELSDILFPTN